MDLKFFLSDDLLTASKKFFNKILGIPTADAATSSIHINELLRDYISDTKLLSKIVDARFAGMINDSTLGGNPDKEIASIETDYSDKNYDKLLLFSVKVRNGISLTKTDISRLTRALNRRSASRPVVLLAQYMQMLSFSAAERGQYQRPGMKGEKIGRISILKDINLNQVHAGHERILLQLKIDPLKVQSFNELYLKWQEVFNISILNKQLGILHKMVFALGKLDPGNRKWKQAQLEKAERDMNRAKQFEDENLRETAIQNAQEKIRYVKESFGKKQHALDYTRKLFLIENCIYGVDIQQIAVQISKLRFFISLMVDQRVDDSKPNRNMLSLPNLETKFVAANTLIPLEKPEQLVIKGPEIEKVEKELHAIRQKIFFTRKYSEKKKLKETERKKRKELKDALVKVGFPENSAGQVASWDPFDPLHSSAFFDPEIMFAIEGDKKGGFFNVVIGNPPYIKEYTFKDAFNDLRDSEYYIGKMDIWYFFACKGIDFLLNKGILSFIASNNWVTNFGAKKLRNKVLVETIILQLLDFNNYKIFEASDIQTMVMLFQKNDRLKDIYFIDYRKLNNNSLNFNHVLDLLNRSRSGDNIIYKPKIIHSKYIDRYLLFSNEKEEMVLTEILSKSNFSLLENGDRNKKILPEIGQGIVVPQETLNRKNLNKLKNNNYSYGEGIFLLTRTELNRFKLNDFEKELIKPFFTSKQLKRFYSIPENKFYIIYTDSRFSLNNLKKRNSQIKLNDFPAIKAHLDRFKEIITSDNRPYGLHRAREQRLFEGEKIFALRKSPVRPIFTYNNFSCYVSQSYNIIKTNRINNKFLISILNSKLIAFWLRNKGKMQGSNYQLDNEPLSQLPLIKPKNEIMEPFIKIVEIIIERKPISIIDISSLEEKIDLMVYKLYSLTYNECQIVDPEIENLISREDYERMGIDELANYEIPTKI